MSVSHAEHQKPIRPTHVETFNNEEVAVAVPDVWEPVDDIPIMNGDDDQDDGDETPVEVEKLKVGVDPKTPFCR